MSKEIEFVILMSIRTMSPEQERRALELYRVGLNGETLFYQVNRNRVWPIVFHNMKRLQLEKTEIFDKVSVRANQCAITNMKLTSSLTAIFHRFEEEHIDALAMKGPVLAQLIYGNVAMRASKDLDILARKDQLYQVIDVLENMGFHMLHGATTPKRRDFYLNVAKVYHFGMSNGEVEVEIHWQLGNFEKVDFDELYDLRDTYSICGTTVYVPNRSMNLYCLVSHGVKHGFLRTRWLMDIYELLKREDCPDLQEIYRFFDSKKTGYMLLATVKLLSTFGLYGEVRIEANQEEYVAADRLHDAMVRLVLADNETEQKERYAAFESVFGRELNRRGLKKHTPWKTGLLPSDVLLEAFDLPDSMFFVYYILVVPHWIWRHTPFYKGNRQPDSLRNVFKRR